MLAIVHPPLIYWVSGEELTAEVFQEQICFGLSMKGKAEVLNKAYLPSGTVSSSK